VYYNTFWLFFQLKSNKIIFWDARFLILDAGYLMLDTRCWILDAGYSMLDSRCWILDAGYSMLDTSKNYRTALIFLPLLRKKCNPALTGVSVGQAPIT
jgi:hypothetical protein